MSNYYAKGNWNSEVGRLKDMDAAFAPVAEADLKPAISRHIGGKMLDIGAGTGVTISGLCKDKMEYFALDITPAYLAQRPEDDAHKINASNSAIPLPDGSIDLTFARAVYGWSKPPKDALVEQLRVTKRDDGEAVITELDWEGAQAGKGMNPEYAQLLMGIKSRLIDGLAMAGFNAYYGQTLGRDLDEVMRDNNFQGKRREQSYIFPEDDHRGLLTDAATSFITRVKEVLPTLPDELKRLEDDVSSLQEVPEGELSFTIPTLVTQHITMSRND